ncbi:MAG: cyclic nucleotide-binding domain-containing protein [Candidatus Tenebribacter davisii]|jgi:CRP-like cAMP-binding protein|nr:cyclic nucleotide-binding domain-containing protein [Candidatus Tenebribacter davisii]
MDIAFLNKVNLVQELTTSELKIFSTKLKTVKYKENEIIIEENKESDKLFILYKGEVVISKKMTMIDEREKIDKTFIKIYADDHAFFGEIGLLGLHKRTASCRAKTECTLYTIDYKDFMSICNTNPEIGFKMLLEIARKLSGLLEKNNEDVLKLTTALCYALKG